jgi:hypothetical protein
MSIKGRWWRGSNGQVVKKPMAHRQEDLGPGTAATDEDRGPRHLLL